MARKQKFTPGPVPEGHIVEEYKFGNTRCYICDDSVVKTQKEVDEILERCAKIAYSALLRQAVANGEFVPDST